MVPNFRTDSLNRRNFLGVAAAAGAMVASSRVIGPAQAHHDHAVPAGHPVSSTHSTITLGDVTVTRVIEFYGTIGLGPTALLPDSPMSLWQQNKSWLDPHFWLPSQGLLPLAVQTWVLRSEGRTILVDTGVGNGKYRPNSPIWSYLNTDYLGSLARAGVHPEDVDIVVNTHIHADHVGWNTRLEGRKWVPTFPNAKYLVSKADFTYWNPEGPYHPRLAHDIQNTYEDSIAPVHDAGQIQLWEGSHTIDRNLRLQLTPGHTPGSSTLWLESKSDRALFVGDCLHSPVQIIRPEYNSCFEEDEKAARKTRAKVLGWAADHNALVFPQHMGGHGAAEVMRKGSDFTIKDWAGFFVPTKVEVA
ncbi:MBL fold metallo-hydrolase [Streptomyces sp. NPDC059489]|uniref:MBL fold metallo-hydrolase n=1 Tax=Streptomyces sp. NPDC059489 TaxID=3346849 RepID=UPI0036B6CF68